jgi:hypothetical protein
MAKSATQRTREHIARIRRKAQAYDEIIDKFQNLQQFVQDGMPETIAAHHMRRLLDASVEKVAE